MTIHSNELTQSTRRPASHKWAIFVLLIFLAVNTMLMFKGAFDVVTGVIIVLCISALAGSFIFTRAKQTFLIASITLALIILRGVYYAVLQPAYQLLTHNPDAQQGWLTIGFQAFFIVLLMSLLRAYAFGTASRNFYRLHQVSDHLE